MKKKKNAAFVVIVTALIFAALAGGCDIFNPVIDKWWVGDTPVAFAARLDSYRITFDSNGGDYIDLINTPIPDPVTNKSNPWPQDIIPGMKASEPGLVTWASHYLSGWFTTEAAANTNNTADRWDFSKPPSGNMTLYAGWTTGLGNGKTIEFNVNPPAGDPGLNWTNCVYTPLPELIAKDRQLTEPKQFGLKTSDPLASKYYFDGWYTSETPLPTDKAWDFSTGIADDTTDALSDGPIANGTIKLYAKWSRIDGSTPIYNVTFDSDGANADRGKDPNPPAQKVPQRGTVTEPNALTKTDYVFDGWYADGSNTPYSFGDPVNSNLTLRARWKIKPYSTTWFNDNGYHLVIKNTDEFSTKPYYPFQYDQGESTVNVPSEYEDNTYNQIDIYEYLRDNPTAVAVIKGYGDDNDIDTNNLIKKREQNMFYFLYEDTGISADRLIKYADFNNGAGIVGGSDVDEVKVYIYDK